jgi:dolichol-phosphate mannosyltransferase
MLNVQTRPWTDWRLPVPAIAKRFVMFMSVGASGSAMNFVLFWLLASRLGMQYLVASTLAFEISMLSNYMLNNNWTFKDRRSGRFSMRGLASYQAVSLGALGINLVVLQFTLGHLGIHPQIANLLAIGVGSFWNFVMNMAWTWRKKVPRPVVNTWAHSVPAVISESSNGS